MIKVRCSLLEDAKQNPKRFAQYLLESAGKPQGSRGMFAYWQDVARQLLREKMTDADAIKLLEQKFLIFADTRKNQERQEALIEQLHRFARECRRQRFVWEDGQHRMNWELYAGVSLTGLTPIIVHNNDEYFCFLMIQEPLDWQEELRFPLFQQYLADYVLHCNVEEVNVGVYILAENRFIFNKYTAAELGDAVDETSQLFEQVQIQYINLKKTSHAVR